MKLFIIFVVLNVLNVIIQTIKSIATIKCSKGIAALVNAIAYGLYTVVLVYMVCDLPLWVKVVVVGTANLIGVYIVKLFEEKSRKDKLWKVEFSVRKTRKEKLIADLIKLDIPFNEVNTTGKWVIVNCYCYTQKDSMLVKSIAEKNGGVKYFVSETKNL